MSLLVSFCPIFLFVVLYVGAGIYFSLMGVENSFYQLSPNVAIIPGIILAWIIHKGPTKHRFDQFIDGVRHKDIITMCIIFILAGAFSTVTTSIGSVDATINCGLSLIPQNYLLIGLFLIAAFISTAIGTSMGTIATIAPITAGLSAQGAFPATLGLATIVGGAMFGDNLSIISDTTIASVSSQEANMKDKFKLNAMLALISSFFTIIILLFVHDTQTFIEPKPYNFMLVTPYLFLILFAMTGVNVFIVLLLSILYASIIGYIHHDYSILDLSKDITIGFKSMHDIMLLSLLIGGLSGLSQKGSKQLAQKLGDWISKKGSKTFAQLVIAKIVSIFDLLLANNTVAIIVSGEIAREIAKKHHVPPHYSATILAIFSCVFQGIIPYGAQLLLAASIAGLSPLSLTPYVYYCYILGAVTIIFILLRKLKKT